MGEERTTAKGFRQRLDDGDSIVIAEGYLFEFERRCYLKAGPYVPEVVLEYPDLVRTMHEEFVHAGSDVVLAFTYYGHREKMRQAGREGDLERMNRTALRIAREVADQTGTLMAGDICNTTAYDPDRPETHDAVREMFKEQIEWIVEEKADFIVVETMGHIGEALLAMEAVKQYGKGLEAVVTMAIYFEDQTFEGTDIVTAMQQLEAAGAAVVGLNCGRGPITMLPTMRKIRERVKIPIAALPVAYRTDTKSPTLHSLKDPESGDRAFPMNLGPHSCSRDDIARFAMEARQIDIQYVGLCCGNCGHLTRTLAEMMGKSPPGSKYSPDMSDHFLFGKKSQAHNKQLIKQMSGTDLKHPEFVKEVI